MKQLLKEVKRQLEASRNDISHIAITEKWTQQNGKIKYRDNEN